MLQTRTADAMRFTFFYRLQTAALCFCATFAALRAGRSDSFTDWYIIKNSDTTFSWCWSSCDCSGGCYQWEGWWLCKSGLSTSQIVQMILPGFVPFIISMIFPQWVFIAVIFFTSKMAGEDRRSLLSGQWCTLQPCCVLYSQEKLMLGGFSGLPASSGLPRPMVFTVLSGQLYYDTKSSLRAGWGQ